VRQAALGLQHAFEQGMVHRDIKPQNLMLTPKGQVKVLDFGLARLRATGPRAGGLTQTGAFMGTPEYVSPEQATDARTADSRADLYSLGCTLYFLLTGRPPFVADTAVKLVLAHIEREPTPLRELRPDVPEALSAVVGRLLAKDPGQRYQTPVELAQALVPFIKAGAKGAPVPMVSRPQGAASPDQGTIIGADTSRMGKLERGGGGRAPAAQAAAQGDAADPFTSLVAAPDLRQKLTTSARVIAGRWARQWWLMATAVAVVLVGIVGLWAGGVFKVKTKDGTIVLENLPPDAQVLVDGGTVTVTSADGKTFEVRVDPGKKHRLAVKKDGFKVFGEEVELDVGGRKSVLVRLEPSGPPAPTPKPGPPTTESEKVDPKLRLAYKTLSGEWKIDGDELVQEPLFGECNLVFGDFAWKDYDFRCEAKITTRNTSNRSVSLLYRVTGAGRNQLAFGNWNNTWDLVEGFEHGKRVEFGSRRGALEPDNWYKLAVQVRGTEGKCFVNDEQVFKYVDKRNPQGSVGLRTWNTAARFRNIRVTDPAGKVLFEGLPKLPAIADEWFPATEPASANELKCLKGHGAPVSDVTFSPDGRKIVSVSNGRIWGDKVGPNGGPAINVSSASTLRLWNAETGKELDRSPIRPSRWMADKLVWAPGSSRFITAFGEASPPGYALGVRLWSIEGAMLKSELLFPENFGGTTELSFTPDGRKVLAFGAQWDGRLWHEGRIMDWDVKGKTLARQLPGTLKEANGRCQAISPNGRLALLARKDQPFAEIDLSTGKETGRWKEAAVGIIRSLAFSRDSTRVLTGGNDGSVRLWDVAKAEQLRLIGTHQLPVLAVAFSPDGRRALTGGDDQTVRLWGLEGKKQLAFFTGHTGAVQAVAFSPDGRRGASGGADYTVRLWRLPPAER
jgi:WD40 repeat protein